MKIERIATLFCAALLIVAISRFPSAGAGNASNAFSPTGSMHAARGDFSATRLPNGDVLVAGGLDRNGLSMNGAELYAPPTGTWMRTASLSVYRGAHTATLLSDGTVLVAGGCGGDNCTAVFAGTEIYHPNTRRWFNGTHMKFARYSHTATLFTAGPLVGKVLVTGGCCDYRGGGGPYAATELYDPATSMWTRVGNMVTPRWTHTATMLPSGKVLVAGGRDNHGNIVTTAELFDPITLKWTTTGSMSTARSGHAAALLADGRVLVAGGYNATASIATAEIYAASMGRWIPTGTMHVGRYLPTATRLISGRVLFDGGSDSNGGSLASAEYYDPAGGQWTATAPMSTFRSGQQATMLLDGKVLVSGGCCSLKSAELYTP